MTELKFQIQLTKSTTFLRIMLEIQRVFLYKRSRLVRKNFIKAKTNSIFYYKKKRLEHNRHYYQHI